MSLLDAPKSTPGDLIPALGFILLEPMPIPQQQCRVRNLSLLVGPYQVSDHLQFSGFHLDRVHLQAIPTPTRALRARVGVGNCFPSDNWQHCRSLDESIALVRSVYGPSGLVFSRLRIKCGVCRYRQHSGRLQGVRLTPLRVVLDRRLFPIDRRPSITLKIDLESMTSQRPPNFRVS